MDCTSTLTHTDSVATTRADNGAAVLGQHIQVYGDTNYKEPAELYDADVNTRAEGPFDAKEDDSSRSDSEDDPAWSDTDDDPALKYYHKEDVAYRRSNGLDFEECYDGGFWYRPGGGFCAQRARGVVFEDVGV